MNKQIKRIKEKIEVLYATRLKIDRKYCRDTTATYRELRSLQNKLADLEKMEADLDDIREKQT